MAVIKAEIAKLALQPGDKLVLKVGAIISREVKQIILDRITEWAKDTPILILDKTMDLVIVSEEDVTRFIRGVMHLGEGYEWKCEQCSVIIFNGEDFNFCPGCGRKIVEFVDYAESEEAE